MKFRNTIIIVVALALLAGYVYYDQQQTAQQPTATPVPPIRVLDVKADDVTGIQVSSPVSRTVVHLEKDVWMLDEPTKAEADTARLNNLAAQFARLTATRALTETPSNLAPFGLLTGTLTVTLQLKDNRSEVVRFGDAALQSSAYYAQHVGDPKVYLVAPGTYSDAKRLLEVLPTKPTPVPTLPPIDTPAVLPPTPAATPAGAPTAAPSPTAKP